MEALVVAPRLGGRSEPWLWRQLTALGSIDPRIMVAEWVNRGEYPFDAAKVAVDDLVRICDTGPRRWTRRLSRLSKQNFFALDRRELQQVLRLIDVWPRPDVILCHFGQTAVRFIPLAEHLKVPIVAHFHGLDVSSMLQSHRWYRWSLRLNLDKFAAVVVVSERQREVLEKLGIEGGRIHVIPCGAPIHPVDRIVRTRGGAVEFVSVSRLVRWKGVHVALRAFALARGQAPTIKFKVVGDGPQEQELRTLASELGIEGDVEFLGGLEQSDVREVLDASDVLVQHSLEPPNGWFEGFGVNVTEAAAAGLPVIASASGGLLDQVVDGETGCIVPIGDVKVTSERMVELAGDPELRRRLGCAGRERARHHFDTAVLSRRLEGLLHEVGSGVMEDTSRRLPFRR